MDSAYVRQVLLRTQNGSDIRGSVIATEKEEKRGDASPAYPA